MFKVDNNEIGRYIADRIRESRFKSARQFGRAYLELRGDTTDDDDLQKMANRVSQIIKGKKRIQLEDLPLFSELLGVSIEDIISAGTSSKPISNRPCNYKIAHSDNPDEWEAYINREDKLFLNPDEYNKTVLDYAIEFGNYALLKYLMDKHYIWFVGDDVKKYHPSYYEYGAGFGAGTDIIRRDQSHIDLLDLKLKEGDDLRFGIMTLAIKNKDFEILNELHAREIPHLYQLGYFLTRNPQNEKFTYTKNVDRFISNLASCPGETLKYFFEPFSIESSWGNETNTFVFPYVGELLDCMIKQKNKSTLRFLKVTLKRNREIIEKLKKDIEESMARCKENLRSYGYDDANTEARCRAQALYDYYFYPVNGFVAYTPPIFGKGEHATGYITNVAHVTRKSSDDEIQYRINEINETYDEFNELLKEKEAAYERTNI